MYNWLIIGFGKEDKDLKNEDQRMNKITYEKWAGRVDNGQAGLTMGGWGWEWVNGRSEGWERGSDSAGVIDEKGLLSDYLNIFLQKISIHFGIF